MAAACLVEGHIRQHYLCKCKSALTSLKHHVAQILGRGDRLLCSHIAERKLSCPEVFPDWAEFTETGTPCNNLMLPVINTFLKETSRAASHSNFWTVYGVAIPHLSQGNASVNEVLLCYSVLPHWASCFWYHTVHPHWSSSSANFDITPKTPPDNRRFAVHAEMGNQLIPINFL